MKKKNTILTLGFAATLAVAVAAVSIPKTLAQVHAASVASTIAVHNQDLGAWGKAVTITFNPDAGDVGHWASDNSMTYSGTGVTMATYKNESSAVSSWFAYSNTAMTSYNNVNHYGDVITVPANSSWTSNKTGNTYTVADEAKFVCKIANGAFGDWTPFVAPSTVSFANATQDVGIGNTASVALNVVTTESDPLKFYESSDPTIATIDASGTVTGVKAGTVTITGYSGLKSATTTVNVVKGKTQTGIEITAPADKTITTYKGLDWNEKKITVVPVYDDGTKGSALTEWSKAANVTGTFDKDTVGTYPLTLTIGSFTASFTVKVEAVAAETKVSSFGNGGLAAAWGAGFFVVMDNGGTQNTNLSGAALDNWTSHVSVASSSTALKNVKGLSNNYLFYLDSATPAFKAGDVIKLSAGLYTWNYTGTINSASQDVNGDGEWAPIAELKQDVKFVYTGSAWASFVSDVTDFGVSWAGATFVGVGQTVNATVSCLPAGAYGVPTFASSDTSIVTVSDNGAITGVKKGEAIITVTLGSVVHKYTITVTDPKVIKGVSFAGTPNYYSVVKGSKAADFNPTLKSFKLVYEDDTLSPEIALPEGTYTIDHTFSTDADADLKVAVSVTYQGKSLQGTLPVKVYSYYNQKVETCSIVSWFSFWMFADCPNTSGNSGVNITGGNIIKDAMSNYITYARKDGTAVTVANIWLLGHNIAIQPQFVADAPKKSDGQPDINMDNYNKGDYYQTGDILTVKKGCPLLRWTGDKNGSDPVEGTGEYIIDGFTQEDVQYTFDGSAMVYYKKATGLTALKDSVTVQVGKATTAGISRTPSDATTGTITYVSSDSSIATVSSNGTILGVKPGNCTVTGTYKDDAGQTFTKTINVTVTDIVTGINVTSPTADKPLEVTQGQDLDLSKVTGTYVYASGKAGEAVDFTTASVSGFDKNTASTQNVTLTLVKDGVTLTATISVKVVAPKKGCGGAIASGVGVGVIALAGIAALIIRKKHTKKD